ncbi:MAG: tetratricopeptide repeat protein [Chitinophagaceae bacterium]|nr:tetratricopeptide repeat protein [Chitinophagaceae bacterium]
MRKFLLILFFLSGPVFLFPVIGQENVTVDSLRKAVEMARSPEQKTELMDELSRVLMNINLPQAEEWGQKLIRLAEESRDRKLMFKAYLSNGVRNGYMVNQKAYADKAIAYYNKALELARENRMSEETGTAQMQLARIHLMMSDKDKALSYASQAFSLISTLPNDSLRAEAYNSYGQVYQARRENVLALRNYFSALRIGERIKNPVVIRNCYLYLSAFYAEIGDYDKAIDFMTLAYRKMDEVKEKNAAYQKVIYTNSIGNYFASKKNYDIAISYFEKSIRMADSLKFSSLKVPGYLSLLNQYLRLDEPQKALDYLNSSAGDGLKKYLINVGMAHAIDQAYGVIYTGLNQFDSAKTRLEKARPIFENSSTLSSRINFYIQMAYYHRKAGNTAEAISYFQKVLELSEAGGLLENVERSARHLDTLYRLKGDLAEAGRYSVMSYRYKDSIETMKREKEMAQVEADDERQRQLLAEREATERKNRRNNIQYLAIVIGIISLFVTLVILGMFKVSRTLMRALGFFVFLMFFEFIFLVFKKNIYSVTQGEPWKDLAFMIALAAVLVPLHHWLEHKVLHYLTSHNRLTAAGTTLRSRLFGRNSPGN